MNIIFTQDYLTGSKPEFIYFVYIIVGRVTLDNATIIKITEGELFQLMMPCKSPKLHFQYFKLVTQIFQNNSSMCEGVNAVKLNKYRVFV